jgi:chemotaxis protein histidine kinase CheA
MPRKISRELLQGFLAEVQDSLAAIGELLQTLAQGEWEKPTLEECHRLAHSIKGAALMVQFPSLELIGRLLEEVLEDAMAKEDAVQETVLATCFALWESLAGYVEGLNQNTLNEEHILTEAVGAYCDFFPSLGEEQVALLQESIAASVNSPSLQLLLGKTQVDVEAASKKTKGGKSKSKANEEPKSKEEPEAKAETAKETSQASEGIDPAIIEGIDRDLKDRDNVPAELIEVFNEEAADHLKSLYRTLEDIEKDEPSPERVQELRRSAHTLKGAAGAVGLRTITQIAHRMEDLLDCLYDEKLKPTPAQIKLIYQTTDTLQDLATGSFDPLAIRQRVAEIYVQLDQELKAASEQPKVQEPAKPVEPAKARPKKAEPAKIEQAPPKPAPIKPPAPVSRPLAAQLLESVHQGPGLRVPLERIDEISRLVGELIINRSSLEQRMNSFRNFVDELQLSLDRLRRIAQEIEAQYEVAAL